MTKGSGPRAAALVLAAWSLFFAALAISRMRYANDCAPAAALCFTLGVSGVAGSVLRRWRSGPVPAGGKLALGSILWLVLMAPALTAVFLPRAIGSIAALRGDERVRERAVATVSATLARFLADVRQVTPETSGYLDDWRGAPRPEYGVIAHPNLGHAIQYVARRATGTDPFWAYIGERNWAFTASFLRARTEEQALRAASVLDGRYVVTMPMREEGTVPWRLHFYDGNATGAQPPLRHFRLVTESTGPGQSLLARSRPDPPGTPAYKLFEIVEGAEIHVTAAPDAIVRASVGLVTPAGRKFEHTVRVRADETGLARLRLPYATDTTTPVRAQGRYRVHAGGQVRMLAVAEEDVVSGNVIRLRGP